MSNHSEEPPTDFDGIIRMAYPLATKNSTLYITGGSDGWEEIIFEGIGQIEEELEKNPVPFRITDIKSKFGCYDEETEVLTESGWKRFKDVTHDDKMACLDDDGYMHYQFPTDIIKAPYEGDMYQINTRAVDLLVTPNHNLWVSQATTHGGIGDVGKKEYPFELQTYEALYRKPKRFQKGAKWRGASPSHIEVPAYSFTKIDGRVHNYPAKRLPIEPLVRFLGWFVAEGSIDQRNCRGLTLSLNGTDTQEGKHVEAIMNQLGIGYKSKHKKVVNDYSIRIHNTQFNRWVNEMCGHLSPNRRVPVFIKGLSPELIRLFLEELFLGDGQQTPTANILTTVSKQLSDDVQELIVKAGGVPRVYGPRGPRITYIKGRKIQGKYRAYYINWLKNTFYHTTLHNRDNKETIERKENLVPYKGMVYCATVPGNKLYVRRGGKSVWCGNSLRFYYNGGSEGIEQIVDSMEARSRTTCEICGALGRLKGQGWVYTACPQHIREEDK